jgi:hypothetical protein
MLPALIVGALTAWYLGLKLGLIVAGITFGAIVVASVVPGMTITVYVLVAAWCALLYFFGARIRAQNGSSVAGQAARMTGSAMGTVGRWVGKAKKMFDGSAK